MDESSDTIKWSGFDHDHEEKGSDWYWALGVIAVALALTAVVFSNVLFAILIVIASLTVGMLAAKPPKIVTFTINRRGFSIDNTRYPYEVIDAFWITDEEDESPALLIDTQKPMTPHLVIPLTGVDSELVREYLSEFVPEEELREPLAHKLFEMLGM